MLSRRQFLATLGATAALRVRAAEHAVIRSPVDVLVIAPHPDDETIGCAGVILQAIARQERVAIAVLTQGDAHVKLTAVAAKKNQQELVPEDYIAAGILRQRHALRAAAGLGVPDDDVDFLGYPDSGLGPMFKGANATPFQQPYTFKRETYAGARRDYHSAVHGRPASYTRASLTRDLSEIIRTRQPKSVYVTHESDRHADHQAAFWFAREALRAAESAARLFTFLVHGVPPSRPPDLRLVLTPSQLAAKRAALLMHQVGVSPVHDYLAPQFAKPEEVFWEVTAP